MCASPKTEIQIQSNSAEPRVNAGRGAIPRPDWRRGLTIADAKAALPLPELMDRLGFGAHAKKSARCPFHDDGNNSFSVWESNGTWFFKCHAGCGEGDEINFLEKHKGISRRDGTRLYLEIARGRIRPVAVTPRTGTRSNSVPAPLDWAACVQNLTPEARKKIADKRGYSLPFVDWLHGNKLIGNFAKHVAFPVQDNGEVLGVHYKCGDGWRYAPVRTKTRPFIIGELVAGERVHVFESQWDAFAYMDKSGQFPCDNIIITRGAGNGALVAGLIPVGSVVCAWPQNDDAGEKLPQDICANTTATVKRVRFPAAYKDLNDWVRAGASVEDLLEAIENAEVIQERLSPEKLFHDVKCYLIRYIVFSKPEHADVITLWIMHTWVVDAADYTPYIYLYSPVMRCGKTQAQKVAEPLVRNPLRTCNVSEAALYREIEESRPTLLWDEIDSIFGNRKTSEANENKRALLNAGHERGMRAIRMERGPGGFVKISFDPFCPKLLAGIGRLPDTIVDRSIPILIHRKLKTQPCQKYRRKDRDSAKLLHDALEVWSKDPELLGTLRESQPQMPESLSDRQEDIWEPLLAIADAIGGDVPTLVRKAARVLCDNGEDELSYGATQLLAIKKVIGDQDRISSADLIDGLWEGDTLPSKFMEGEQPNHKKIGRWLSKFVQSYGGKPARKLRFDERTWMGYEASDLKQIFDRYCPAEQ